MRFFKQVGSLHTKHRRKPINYVYARAVYRALKGAYVGSVKVGAVSKFFLRQSFRLAKAPQIFCKCFAYLHTRQRKRL